MSPLVRIYASLTLLSVTSCAKTMVTIESDAPTQVDKLTLGDWKDPGEKLGQTPLNVELSDVQGALLRLSRPNKQPLYWTISSSQSETLRIKAKLQDQSTILASDTSGSGVCGKQAAGATNRVLRIMMKAYKALADKNYPKAREWADEAAALDEKLAAPLVIKAIAFAKSGDMSSARLTLRKAEQLDPDDDDMKSLLKTLGEGT